jgi:O-antigen ligase
MGVAALGVAEAINLRPVVEWLAGFRHQASFSVGDVLRVSSTLPHPNIAAMLLGLCLPVQLAWMATSRASWARIGLGLGAAAELAVLALTVSRAGVLVVELVLVLMLALAARQHVGRLARISLGAALGLPLLIGGAIALQPLLLLRLTSETAQDWYRADYATPRAVTAQPGQAATVAVRLANTGPRSWSATGEHPFALSYHLDQLDGTSLSYDGLRTPLPADLPPGGVVDLQARLIAPPTPGTYLVEWDGVQESVTWFSWTGTPAGRTYLTVEGPPAAGDTLLSSFTAPPSSLVAPPPGRLMQWRMAVRMAGNRPLLGVGPDNFRWVYGDFAGLATWDTGGHANSLYFEWLADTGFIGLGLFLWLSWAVMRAAFVSLGVGASAWRVAVLGSLAAWFLHGFVDYFYEPLPTNVAFWLVAGLAVTASACGRQHHPEASACVLAST